MAMQFVDKRDYFKYNRKPDGSYENTAEKLIRTNEELFDYSKYFIGLSLWESGDKLKFLNKPVFNIKEEYDKAYINRAGSEVACLNLLFFNLEEALGELSKITVYYEIVDFKDPIPSSIISLKKLQRKNLFCEIPVLSIDNSLSFLQELTLPKPRIYCNFWAVYTDSSNRIATIDNKPIINSIYKYPINGVFPTEGLVEAKGLVMEDLNCDADLNGRGFPSITHLDKEEQRLVWANPRLAASDEQYKAWYGSPAYFIDSFGHRVSVKYSDFKARFEYFVIYKFVSDNGEPPVYKRPLQLDYRITQHPMVKDENGQWFLVDRIDANKDTYTVNLKTNEITGYWVGMKFSYE